MALSDLIEVARPPTPNPRPLPDDTERPTALIRLTVRLEDWSVDPHEDVVPGGVPMPNPQAVKNQQQKTAQQQLASARAGAVSFGTNVSIDEQADAIKTANASSVQAGGKQGSAGPAPESVGLDDQSIVLYAVPTTVDLELKTFLHADRLQFTIALRDLPILPEMVRSMLIDCYMGLVSAQDFGDTLDWSQFKPQVGRNPMFRGYATDVEMTADGQQVQVQAFSLEQVLMDKDIDPLTRSRRIKGNGEPITSYVKRFVQTIPEFAGIDVVFYPNYDDAQKRILDKKLFVRTLQTAQSRNQAAGGQIATQGASPGTDTAATLGTGNPTMPAPTAGQRLKAWAVIVRACELVGLMPMYDPVVNPNAILIVPPSNLMETPEEGVTVASGGEREDPKFERQFLDGGTTFVKRGVRLFVYGRNLKTMKLSRKFTRQRPRAVRVVCYNPDARGKSKVLIAQYPTPKQLGGILRGTYSSAMGVQTKGKPGRGHRPIDEIVTVTIEGGRDQETLNRIALALYHGLSRKEVAVVIETDDFKSFVDPAFPEARNVNPDLLRLRPGTPVIVRVAQGQVDPAKGLVVDTLADIFARRANPSFLRKMLLEQRIRAGVFRSQDDFQALEANLRKMEQAYGTSKLTDVFYPNCVVHHFEADSGYSCRMELVNFVEARNLPNVLGKQDTKLDDQQKKVKPGKGADGRKIAIQQNAENDVLLQLASQTFRKTGT